ncbi:MAG TPA: potassium channel family protein [Aliidongia sp.]|uniref:potassium channel family protein n=1 Tax=Aliidongia sp. TaxID=1914230 RepID=UPI002DDCD9D3|nr:potassium channel family protein [Aliidongia sp.]HEV2675402.1 potassium channel family protein [Aliidongia sp.]
MMATIAAVSAGLVLIVLVMQDVFEVLLLPRRVRRRWRLAGILFKTTWSGWSCVARLLPEGHGRAAFLSIYGPLSVVVLYLAWASTLIFGYGLCQWGFNADGPAAPSLLSDLYFSGSTFFTLGFGDVVPHTRTGKVFAVMEAGSGFGLIAAVIGYLPVLYQLFSRREAHIIQLDARAGSPPSALSLLAGHADGDAMGELDMFLRAWEVWGAELLESHLSYPMLVAYRSQHDNQSWLAALTTIMDTSAVVLCGLKGTKTFQARMTFAMGRMVIIEMTKVLGLSPATPATGRLTTERYEVFMGRLSQIGLQPAETGAEERLAAFRTTYEPFLLALSQFLMLRLPDWMPTSTPDNWQTSIHGDLAKRLVDDAPSRPS